MKIALFSDTYIPDINGVATSTNILRNKLVNLGHDVLVVTSELPSDTTYDESLDDQVLECQDSEIQALYGYRACNIFSFKGMRNAKDLIQRSFMFKQNLVLVFLEESLRIFRYSCCLYVSYYVDRLFTLY